MATVCCMSFGKLREGKKYWKYIIISNNLERKCCHVKPKYLSLVHKMTLILLNPPTCGCLTLLPQIHHTDRVTMWHCNVTTLDMKIIAHERRSTGPLGCVLYWAAPELDPSTDRWGIMDIATSTQRSQASHRLKVSSRQQQLNEHRWDPSKHSLQHASTVQPSPFSSSARSTEALVKQCWDDIRQDWSKFDTISIRKYLNWSQCFALGGPAECIPKRAV